MSTTTPALFPGRPKVYFLAICRECNAGRRPLPMPFGNETARDLWADGHRTTGHYVAEGVEIRPDQTKGMSPNAIAEPAQPDRG